MTHAAPCRHYLTVDLSVSAPHKVLSALEDPEAMLAGLVPSVQLVTLVFAVDAARTRRLERALPASLAVVRQLKASGVSLWFEEEHAALTDHAWIDIEALEGT